MTEFATFTGKNVDEAVNNALLQLQITSEKLEYEVVEKGSNGLLGFIGSKPAVIRARKKSDFIDEGEEFLQNIFREMNMEVDIAVAYNKEEQVVDIVLTGEDMGILIGKRGQTLDSLQHLVSLVINKHSEEYILCQLLESFLSSFTVILSIQLDTNIFFAVFVYNKSEGEDPFRHVVVLPKKEAIPQRRYYKSYDKGYKTNYDRSAAGTRETAKKLTSEE